MNKYVLWIAVLILMNGFSIAHANHHEDGDAENERNVKV